MKTTALLSIPLLAAGVVHAHTTVQAAWIDDVDQGLSCGLGGFGTPVFERCPGTNNPVKDLTSDSLTCNIKNIEAPTYLQVQAGDKFTFEWHHNTRDATDDIIASSHKGPVQVYIAPAASNGTGDVWVKLWEDAGNTSYWGVDKLIAAKGQHWIEVPNLAAGKYLLRPEILALHEADVAYTANPLRGVQVYLECLQIEIADSGNTTAVELPAGVAFPGAYNYSDPGIVYDLYRKAGLLPYVIPGPSVWAEYTGAGGFEGVE